MKCSFCKAPVERAFTADDGDGGCACICQNCVRDLYIGMVAEEMLPARPVPNQPIGRSLSGRGHVIRLHLRRDR